MDVRGEAVAAYFDYWGKARPPEAGPHFHRLVYHSLDVASVGAVLLRRDPRLLARLVAASGLTRESVKALATFALAVHDLGKFGASFQDLKPELVAELQGPRARRGYSTRHDAMGLSSWCSLVAGQAIQEGWIQLDNPGEPLEVRDLELLTEPWFRAVLGHHGQPAIDQGAIRLHFPPKERARSDLLVFVRDVAKLLGPVHLRFAEPLLSAGLEEKLKPSSWMIAGIAVLSDWIGSNVDWFPYQSEVVPLDEYWARTQTRAERALEASGILPGRPSAPCSTATLFPSVTAPRPMQRAVEEVEVEGEPQLFILEDLTGSGKTEAAVVLAQRLMSAGSGGGIFFALPTMATANAMFERIQQVVPRLFGEGEEPSVVLAHSGPHLAGLRDVALPPQPCDGDYADGDQTISAQCAAWIADSRKRSLLAHIGVGTLDQALMAAMQVRHGSLRLLGVSRSILVVDEVHAYDAYMTQHLARLLEFQAGLGGTAILLSATIPTEHRQRLTAAFQRGLGVKVPHTPKMDYPLLTAVRRGQVNELAVPPAPGSERSIGVRVLNSPEAVATFVAASVAEGKSVCWIRNTVPDAIDAFDSLRGAISPEQLGLFHARFAMGDRLRIEGEVLRAFGKGSHLHRSQGRALIATQVVEQSLDLDFDELITDLAPMDLIIQRSGRLHRHARPGRSAPTLHILAPEFSDEPAGTWYARLFPRAAHVYSHWGQLWLTHRTLLQEGSLELPAKARALMDAVFSEDARARVPTGLEKASCEAETKRSVQRSVAQAVGVDLRGGYGGDDRPWDTDARVATRLGEPTTLVRLARFTEGVVGPWIAHPAFAWELSQLQVAKRRIAMADPGDAELIEQLQASMPFVDEGTVTVVLREGEEGWLGRAVDHQGRRVRVRYDDKIGLRVERED